MNFRVLFILLEAKNLQEIICTLMPKLVYNYIYQPLPYFIMVS